MVSWGDIMKKLLLASVAVAAIGATGSAGAADLPVYKAPPVVVPVWSWTGFYVGGSLGGELADTTWTATSLTDTPVASGVGTRVFDLASLTRTYDPSGFRGGGYVGYNWQFQKNWLVGIEGDIAWADGTQTAVGLPGCGATACTAGFLPVPGTASHDSASVRMLGDASVRGRLGWLPAPNLLFYGTGGVAWERIESTGSCAPFTVSAYCNELFSQNLPGQTITNATTRTGWTVGGGVEGRVYGNWVARGEYRYADFGTLNEVFPFLSPAGLVPDNTYRYQLSLHTHIVSVGLAYKFDWRPAFASSLW
jgi:outer membrane immunogenic protein